MTNTPAGEKCRNREIEWIGTLIMINFGLSTFFSPDTIAKGSFRYLLDIGLTEGPFKWINITFGTMGIFALYFNGKGLPWSARLRAIRALVGSLVLAYMGLCLIWLTHDTMTLSLGAGTHLILAGMELYSCLRAGADVHEDFRRAALREQIIRHDNVGSVGATGPESSAHTKP